MQFKHPEILWALFLLLIPIIIHLFQLRKFKKTAFTNVKLLEKVVVASRKSKSIKKWLLLFTRLLLFSAVIVAFAQPYFAKKNALTKKETVVYLDDSFSMQAKIQSSTLLENAVQEIIKTVPKENTFTLFTNEIVFKDIILQDIQNDLLTLPFSTKQLTNNEIELKAKTFFSKNTTSIKNLVVISDFQQRILTKTPDSIDNNIHKYWVQIQPDKKENISIDTAYITTVLPNNLELAIELSTTEQVESTPISIYNGDNLIAKTASEFNENKKAKSILSLPKNEIINGKIVIEDNSLTYDNNLYFNINKKEKRKVLAISETDVNFINRIYTEDEFSLTTNTLQNLNYNVLEEQHLIVLNELKSIPSSLQNSLKSFKNNGGHIVIIPSTTINLSSYNLLLSNLNSGSSYGEVNNGAYSLTGINFSHPLFTNVFEKKVTNFQYPKVTTYYHISSSLSKILYFENENPFLVGGNGLYLFSASLSKENSNFKVSPLIVPTFYKMGINSLNNPSLYSVLDQEFMVDIPIKLSKDNILKLAQQDFEFIPEQQTYANKVTFHLNDNLTKDGIFTILNENDTINNISFNHPRNESLLSYIDINSIESINTESTISNLFESLENNNSVTPFWKWFVTLALLFILIEILILKVFK